MPIADKTFPFFEHWYNKGHEYLINTKDGKHFLDKNFRDAYWTPIMNRFNMEHKPHDTIHTCVSMLTQADVKEVTIKKIVGHRGAMSLTEKVYTHLDVQELIDAINKI